MMRNRQHLNNKIISVQAGSTVLKQYVHLVVLLSPGQNLPRQSHLATSWTSWTESIPLPTHAQIIFVLTKHVWYSVMQLQVADGISGGIRVTLSLIHITTSIIAPLITCAEHIAIQHH